MRIFLLAIASCILVGCVHKQPQYCQTVVLGERVRIVEAGDIIEIPDNMPPAKTWYLVDDVGLSIWLGIPYNHIPNGQTAFDEAMDNLDSAEDLKEDMQKKLTEWRESSKE